MGKENSFFWVQRIFNVLIVFILTMFLSTGCEPLRKKFTRQKKKDARVTKMVPLLDPIEYPKKQYSAEDAYKRYYSLFQVWSKELLNEISGNNNRKRVAYILEQVLLSLNEMKGLISGDKKSGLEGWILELNEIRDDLVSPGLSRSLSSIKIKIMSIDKNIRSQYNFKAIQEYLNK